MNKKRLEELIEQFDEDIEILVIDSMGSEFPIDKVEQRGGSIVIFLKRRYKNVDNDKLLLKLEKNRDEKK